MCAHVQQREIKQPGLLSHEGYEHPANAAIAIIKWVNGLKLAVDEGEINEAFGRILVLAIYV